VATIEKLREHLFDTLSALKDKEKPMDIERARAIADVAQVVINSAKVEVEFAKVSGKTKSQFLNPEVLPAGITGTTQHRIK
jgi:hypothetical protein